MSKAFTKEDGPDEVAPTRRPAQDVRLTPEGLAAFTAELRTLEEAPHPDPARRAWLSDLLARAEVLTPPFEPTRASFGVWVTVEDEDGELQRWRLVGAEEADAKDFRLSTGSPMGRALLGREIGDHVVVQRPLGNLELTVRSLSSAAE